MTVETFVYAFFVLLFGLCIGSFLNVVALRGLSGESIVFPPSKCPKCGKKLNWYTNIPVVSYIFLLGKCQFCKKPISIQYPVVEATNGVLYLLLFLKYGLEIKTFFLCVLSSIFVVICITDFREHVVFDLHTYIMIALGLIYNIFHFGDVTVLESVFGILAGLIIFEALSLVGTLTVKNRAFGFGDTLIAMGIGAFFGAKAVLIITFLSILVQAIIAIPMFVYRYIKQKDYTSALAYILIAVCLATLKFMQNISYETYLIVLVILCSILLWCLYIIFKNLKKAQKDGGNFTFLPFGPALVFATVITMFYPQILSILG